MKYLCVQFSVFALICSIMGGCAVATEPPIPREMIVFDYTPIGEATAGSSEVTFAVVGTQVGSGIRIPENSLLADFANNMTKDFMEILTARGFGVRGPFNTYDEMLFPDKKDSDLILTAEFGISLDTSAVRFEPLGEYYWHVVGPVEVKGYIYLLISESLTNEKMWSKKVPITPFTVRYVLPTRSGSNVIAKQNMKYWSATELEHILIQSGAVPQNWALPVVDAEYTPYAYFGHERTQEELAENKRYEAQVKRQGTAIRNIRNIPWEMMTETNFFYNALGKSLQAQYYEVLNKTYGYLNPEEMKIVKSQSQELRRRKVY